MELNTRLTCIGIGIQLEIIGVALRHIFGSVKIKMLSLSLSLVVVPTNINTSIFLILIL